MSTERPSSDETPAAEIDADVRAELIELGERLTAVDGPLVGSGDRESVEDLVYRLVEAIGGSRPAEIGTGELQIEAEGEDTHWRKYTQVPTFRAKCGPFMVRDHGIGDDEADESFLEIAPNGSDEGLVCVDANIKATVDGIEHEQGSLHMLTPRQSRSFAAALLEQAEYVENQ